VTYDQKILSEMTQAMKQAEAVNYALRALYDALERPLTDAERAERNARDSYGGTRDAR